MANKIACISCLIFDASLDYYLYVGSGLSSTNKFQQGASLSRLKQQVRKPKLVDFFREDRDSMILQRAVYLDKKRKFGYCYFINY